MRPFREYARSAYAELDTYQKWQVARMVETIAAETIGKSWIEYELENTRHQLRLLDVPYDEIDRTARVTERCQHRFLVEKQTPEEILKDSPECKASVKTFGVPYTYLQQIADLDLAVEWKTVNIPVLVTYGTADPSTTPEESRYLVDMINGLHRAGVRMEWSEFCRVPLLLAFPLSRWYLPLHEESTCAFGDVVFPIGRDAGG
jgi:pimeloyl-ACP methyl ester carboxylesterase